MFCIYIIYKLLYIYIIFPSTYLFSPKSTLPGSGCLFMRNEIYFNTAIGRYVLSFGFKEWAMQAVPVVDMRFGGKARAPSK